MKPYRMFCVMLLFLSLPLIHAICTDVDADGFGVCPLCNISNGCTYDGDDCNDLDATVFPPANDLVVNQTITLCSGTYYINDTGGAGVMRVFADNITVTCNNTVLMSNDSSVGQQIGSAIYVQDYNNFTLTGCNFTGYQYTVFLNNVIGANVSFNNLNNTNNYGAGHPAAIHTQNVSNSSFEYNNISFNNMGIYYTQNSNNCSIAYNNFSRWNTTGNQGRAILMYNDQGGYNQIHHNIIHAEDCTIGVEFRGTFEDDFYNNTILNADGIGLEFWLIDGGSMFGNTNNNTRIYNNNISGATNLVLSISNYSFEGDVVLVNNITIWNNYFDGGSGMVIRDIGCNNCKWNTTKTLATNIIGGNYTGGNFYNDYTGIDTNGDGIGDTSYTINSTLGSIDYLPLTNDRGNIVSGCMLISSPGSYYMDSDIINSSTSSCIRIGANNVILDCQNHLIDGNDIVSFGVVINRTSLTYTNTVLKNCIISDWSGYGLYERYSRNATFINVSTTSNPSYGFYSVSSRDGKYYNITSTGNAYGFTLSSATSPYLNASKINANTAYGIYLSSVQLGRINNTQAINNSYIDALVLATSTTYCRNIFENVTGSPNLPIKYYNSSVNLNGWNNNASSIILCNADNSVLNNMRIVRSFKRGSGILLTLTDNTNISNFNMTSPYYGVYLYRSNNNRFNNVNMTTPTYGMRFESNSIGNTINASYIKTSAYGAYLAAGSTNNTFINNWILGATTRGIHILSINNSVFNNFFNSTNNVYSVAATPGFISSVNKLNTTNQSGTNILGGSRLGGNYWARPTGNGFSQTCTDATGDGFCDLTYSIAANNVDYLPLTSPDIIPPTGSILTPPNGTKVNGNVSIFATAYDTKGVSNVSVQYMNSTVAWTNVTGCEALTSPNTIFICVWNTAGFPNDGEGYLFKIVPCDLAGNCNATTIPKHYTIDTQIPMDELLLIYPGNQSSIRNGSTIIFKANVTDGSGAGINVSVIDLSLVNGSSNTSMALESGSQLTGQYSLWNMSAIVDGISGFNVIPLYVYDNATPDNNVLFTAYPFLIDNEPPTHSDLSVSDENPYNGTNISIYINVFDNYLVQEYIFESNFTGVLSNASVIGINASVYPAVETINVTTGYYVYKFYMIDDAGNMNETEQQNITVGGNRPGLSILLDNPANGSILVVPENNFSFSYTGWPASSCDLYIDNMLNETFSSPLIDSVIETEKSIANGVHSWVVNCTEDTYGTIKTSETWSFSATTCVDNDGDGFNQTNPGCGDADCDDTNANIRPPLSGFNYISNVILCSGTYTAQNMEMASEVMITCNNTIFNTSANTQPTFEVSNFGIVQNCTFTDGNNNDIVHISGDGIVRYNLFENITNADSTSIGIVALTGTMSARVYGNTFNENEGKAIDISSTEAGSETVISDNLFASTVDCVSSENASGINISSNSFSGCDTAIAFDVNEANEGVSNSIIENNNITGSKYFAIIIAGGLNNEIHGNRIYDNPPVANQGFILSNQYTIYDGNTFDNGIGATIALCDDVFSGGDQIDVIYDGIEAPGCFDGISDVSMFLNDLSSLGFGSNATILMNGTYSDCATVDAWWTIGVGSAPPCYAACVLYTANGATDNYTLNESCFNATFNISSGLTYPPYLNYGDGDVVSYAVYVDGSSTGNLFYNNNFSNTNNAIDSGTNDWNTTKTLETNIMGGPYLGGNYWNDYTGNDSTGDGIGDTPYPIPGGTMQDKLPLIVGEPNITISYGNFEYAELIPYANYSKSNGGIIVGDNGTYFVDYTYSSVNVYADGILTILFLLPIFTVVVIGYYTVGYLRSYLDGKGGMV